MFSINALHITWEFSPFEIKFAEKLDKYITKKVKPI